MLGKTNRGFESLPVRLYFAPTAPRLCFEELEDRVSQIPEGKNGWRRGRSEGAQSRPQSIFEKLTNPTLSDPTTSRSRGTSKGWEDRGIYSRKGRKGRDGGYFLFTFEYVAAVA